MSYLSERNQSSHVNFFYLNYLREHKFRNNVLDTLNLFCCLILEIELTNQYLLKLNLPIAVSCTFHCTHIPYSHQNSLLYIRSLNFRPP